MSNINANTNLPKFNEEKLAARSKVFLTIAKRSKIVNNRGYKFLKSIGIPRSIQYAAQGDGHLVFLPGMPEQSLAFLKSILKPELLEAAHFTEKHLISMANRPIVWIFNCGQSAEFFPTWKLEEFKSFRFGDPTVPGMWLGEDMNAPCVLVDSVLDAMKIRAAGHTGDILSRPLVESKDFDYVKNYARWSENGILVMLKDDPLLHGHKLDYSRMRAIEAVNSVKPRGACVIENSTCNELAEC